MNLLSGKKSAEELMEKVKKKISDNSILIFLLMLLCASQVVTFVRLNNCQKILVQQDLIINELAAGQISLYEILRLQEKIHMLERLSPKKRPVVPDWSIREI
jgi:hypothetical protein